MNKTELVTEIAQRLRLPKQQVTAVLDALTSTVVETVASGDDVTIGGFGKWEKTHRPERDGRDLRTGEPIRIPAKDVPKFTPFGEFKDAVAQGVKEPVAA